MPVAELCDPAVSALFLYSVGAVGSADAAAVLGPWAVHPALALQPAKGHSEGQRCAGQTPDGATCQVDWTLAHDTHLLRVTLRLPGEQPPSAWTRLRHSLDEWVGQVQVSAQALPWAATYLAHGIVRGGTQAAAAALVADASGLGLEPADVVRAEASPYGWLWVRGQSWVQRPGTQEAHWQRELILLTPQDRAQPARALFLEPVNQGLARIELYLHKSAHHARQHEAVRTALEGATSALQGQMLATLHSGDLERPHERSAELDRVAHRLMRFQVQRAQTEVLLNSLRNNLEALNQHLDRVKLETAHYSQQAAQLARQAEQLESDLRNARIVSESTYVFQDIQRAAEATRLERSTYLMGAAAALLAAVAIFNSFVDIWNIVMEGSGLSMPAPWLKALLGALAGVGWPLGAYWAIGRRWGRAAVALGVGFAAMALAVAATVWVNR